MNNTPNQVSQQTIINQHPPQTNQMMQGHNFVNQQQQPVQNVQPQSHMTNPNQNPEMIIKTKKLINELKESLANLMNLASKNINYNHQIDSGQKTSNIEKCPRFERAWGEFNSICNQVETHFKTILECNLLKKESNTHLPFNLSNINVVENQTPPDTIIYNQYVNLVKNKINYAKVLQDILLEGARRISLMDYGLPQQSMQQQQQYNQQAMINNQMTNQYNPNQAMIKNQQQHYQMNPNQLQQQQQMMQRGPPMNSQQINQQQINPQQINQQQINPQQINPQMNMNPQQINPQMNMNPQQINPQQMNPQQINPQQINPQQMNMNPQQMVGQQLVPQQQIVQQQMAPQMNMNAQQQMNPIQMQQPPIQQMHPQQMNNQLGQIKQQPQYIPHNQM